MTDLIMQAWQHRLIDVAAKEGRPNPLPKYGADGLGGSETQAAIEAFQASRVPPLTVTGQFDDPTKAALAPPAPKGLFSMNLSFLTLIIHFLPLLPSLEQDIELEVKTLSSTADGGAKVKQTIAVLEDILSKLKAAL